jgi:glycosyltransferase involved in cell wall biosynthesis
MILKISRKLSKINFHLYGDKSFLTQKNIPNNVKIYNFINYKDIPKTLSRYDVALMPYANIVSGRLSDINLARSMSPMKMFDYLASGKIILASDLKVYKHILKHNFNSILIGNNSKKWIFWTNKIFKLKKRMKYLGLNAKKTSLKYSWDIRSTKILNFAHKSFFV